MSANSVDMKSERATMSLRDTAEATIARNEELTKLIAEVLSQAEEWGKKRNLHLQAARHALTMKTKAIRTAQRMRDLIDK